MTMPESTSLFLVSDYGHVVGLIRMPADTNLKKLNEEFRTLNQAGPNPLRHDTPEQYTWLKKKHAEEDRLAKLYGGYVGGTDGTRIYFSAETFLGWLIKEKGAERIPFKSYQAVELD